MKTTSDESVTTTDDHPLVTFSYLYILHHILSSVWRNCTAVTERGSFSMNTLRLTICTLFGQCCSYNPLWWLDCFFCTGSVNEHVANTAEVRGIKYYRSIYTSHVCTWCTVLQAVHLPTEGLKCHQCRGQTTTLLLSDWLIGTWDVLHGADWPILRTNIIMLITPKRRRCINCINNTEKLCPSCFHKRYSSLIVTHKIIT